MRALDVDSAVLTLHLLARSWPIAQGQGGGGQCRARARARTSGHDPAELMLSPASASFDRLIVQCDGLGTGQDRVPLSCAGTFRPVLTSRGVTFIEPGRS